MNIKVKKYINGELKHLWAKIKILFKDNNNALKIALKTNNRRFKNIKNLDKRVTKLQNLVYIGLGVWVVLQIILVFILTKYF